MPTNGFMPTNAFSSLIIDGLVKINNVHVPVTCSKGIPRPVKTLIFEEEFYIRPDGPPIRPLSKLPPPGDLRLNVSLQRKRLGYGRVGSVYSISIDDPSESSLPPLVIKVANRHRSGNLARETWFYEEMEHIQGASMALCYGFFTGEIDPNSEVLNWAESDENYDPDEIDDYLDGDEGEGDKDTQDATWSKNDSPESRSFCPEFKVCNTTSAEDKHGTEGAMIPSNHTDTPPTSKDDERILVSVLVLERLGDLMPMLVSLEAFKPDIHEVYSDLSRFGVEQVDVRWRNILMAPATHDSLICPYHGHKHQWRVVDFDRARKTNLRHDDIDLAQAAWLRKVFRGVVSGNIIEPWE